VDKVWCNSWYTATGFLSIIDWEYVTVKDLSVRGIKRDTTIHRAGASAKEVRIFTQGREA
jgi:hypothetical protein